MDVAFMACTHEVPDLHSRVIWRDRLVAVMLESHPLAQRYHITSRDLAAETFLVREDGTGPQVHDLIVVRAAGKWPVPTIPRCAVGRGSLLAMVAAGQGISLLVTENLELVPSGIVFREIANEAETVAFSAVWSPYNHRQTLRNLLDLARKTGRSALSTSVVKP